MSTWTHFMDMHSGGGAKEDFEHLYIEAPEGEARAIFYNRFGHNPDRVSCTCCGEDYSVSSGTLTEVTGYERGLRTVHQKREGGRYLPLPDGASHWLEPGEDPPEGYSANSHRFPGRKDIPLAEYEATPGVKFIRADEIEGHERHAEIPEQGYVWRD